jgi:hypothetical protein
VENIGNAPVVVELVDGLPFVKSHGLIMGHVKYMSRTSESWVGVLNHENNVPVYKLKIALTDQPEVDEMDPGGTFSAYFDDRGLLPAIIDPEAVFGPNTDLNVPGAFLGAAEYRVPAWQMFENYTPCGMTFPRIELPPGRTAEIRGMFGHAKDASGVNRIADRCKAASNSLSLSASACTCNCVGGFDTVVLAAATPRHEPDVLLASTAVMAALVGTASINAFKPVNCVRNSAETIGAPLAGLVGS